MTIKNFKTIDNKIDQNRAQYYLDRQIPRIRLYHQEMLVNMNFWTNEDVLLGKDLLEKATAMKRFEYWPLGSVLKKQTSIPKDQYKLFKDQINVVNNKREDGVKAEDVAKTEDGEIIDNIHRRYFGGEYRNLIANIVKYELMDRDLRNKFW